MRAGHRLLRVGAAAAAAAAAAELLLILHLIQPSSAGDPNVLAGCHSASSNCALEFSDIYYYSLNIIHRAGADVTARGAAGTWLERLGERNYVLTLFDWLNLALLLLVLLVIVSARVLYALPLRLEERRRGRIFEFHRVLVDDDNKAVAVSLAGYLAGLTAVVSAALSDFGITTSDGFASPSDQTSDVGVDSRVHIVAHAALFAALGLGLLAVAGAFNRRVTIRGLPILYLMVHEKNLATACVDASGYVASGLVVGAALAGQPSSSLSEDVGVTVLFAALGQMSFIAVAALFRRVTSYDDKAQIKRGNAAAGLSYGLRLIAAALLLANALAKSFSLAGFGLWLGLGTLLLLLLRLLIDKTVLRAELLDKEIERDQNWGAAMVSGTMQIVIVVVLNACLPDECVLPAAYRQLTLHDKLVDKDPVHQTLQVNRLIAIVLFFGLMLASAPLYSLIFHRFIRAFDDAAPMALVDGPVGVGRVSAAAVLPIGMHSQLSLPEHAADAETGRVPDLGNGLASSLLAGSAEEEAVAELLGHELIAEPPPPSRYGSTTPWRFGFSNELLEHDNKAVSISYAAFVFALGWMLAGSMVEGLSQDDTDSSAALRTTGDIAVWMLIGVVFLLASHIIVDRYVMLGYVGSDALAMGNISAACQQGGAYLGSASVLRALTEENTIATFGEDFGTYVIFFALTHAAMVGYATALERLTLANLQSEIRKGNAAVGIFFGLNMASFGILMAGAVTQSGSLLTLVVWTALGGALLCVGRLLCDKLFFRHKTLMNEMMHDQNWGAALISGATSVGLAVLLNTFLRWCPYEFDGA